MEVAVFSFSFELSASIFPCPISSSVNAPRERRNAKTRMWLEQTGPYCTRWNYLGWYFLGCKCSEAGTVSLPGLHCSLQHCRLESLHSNPECLKPIFFFPACCLNKSGTQLASMHVILEHKFIQWEYRKVENPRYSDIWTTIQMGYWGGSVIVGRCKLGLFWPVSACKFTILC